MKTETLWKHPAMRAVLWLVGAVSLVLGVIGIFLPLLPTTPFVLLSAACWMRASPRLHRWLRGHPRFGPMVVGWERQHALPLRLKLLALVTMNASIIASVILMPPRPWLQALLLLIAVSVSIYLLRLPTLGSPTAGKNPRQRAALRLPGEGGISSSHKIEHRGRGQ